MKALIPALICLFASACTSAQPIESVDLDKYKWKNRVLVLFAASDDDAAYERMKSALDDAQEDVDDRDLVLLEVVGNQCVVEGVVAAEAACSTLRDRFGMSADKYGLMLLGKDGQIKLKGNESTSVHDVFGLIDTMPMRRREMRDSLPPAPN